MTEELEAHRAQLKRELRSLFRRHGDSLLAVVSSMLADRDQRMPIGLEGIVIGGSYDPSDGTVQVIRGDSYALLQDDGSEPVAPLRLPVLTFGVDAQHGPGFVGDQSAVIIPTQSGGMVLMHHRPDSSRQTPAGETWLGHRNAAGNIDVDDRSTNDAATAGDGLGGKHILAGGRFTVVTTNGLSAVADDTAGTWTITGKSGSTIVINTDGSITITPASGKKVAIGASASTAGDAVVRKSDLQAALNALAALVQPGSGVTAPTATASATSFTI